MDGGDLRTDLGILPPASAIRPVDSHSPHDHGEGKSRRRPQPPEQEPEAEADPPADKAEQPTHEIDRLA